MISPGSNVDAQQVQRTSILLKQAVGVPPIIRWHKKNAPEILIEAYLYIPKGDSHFPGLPMHMLGVFLEGRTVQHIHTDAVQNGELRQQTSNPTVPNRCAIVPKDRPTHWRPSVSSLTVAMVYLPGQAQTLLETLLHGSEQPVIFYDEVLVSLTRQLLRMKTTAKRNISLYEDKIVGAFLAQLEWLGHADKMSSNKHRNTTSDLAISKALHLIDTHLSDPLSIDRLCQMLQVSATIFRQRFRNATGMPVHRYILQQRLQLARELVDSTNVALSIIASQCGFSSQSHMTSLFQRELGVTPGALRNHAHSGPPKPSEISPDRTSD